MRRLASFGGLLALATITTLLASACSGGGGAGPIPPPTSPAISGAVTSSRGGPAVDGATITAAGTSVSATTNAQGTYVLSVNPGTYDVIAAKPGMAASKFQSVVVQAGQMTTANLIMFPVFDPTKPVSPPTISVTGLSQGQTVTGTISFTVSVTASNPVRRIEMRTSNMDVPPQQSVADSSSATFPLVSTALANGPAFVDLITYDLNQNAAEMNIRFTVNNTVSGGPPATPTGGFFLAVTTGQRVGIFAAQRAQIFSALRITENANILRVGGRSINLLSAPTNATLFVEATWSAVPGAAGYKVLRSFSASGPFVQIAQVTSTVYDDPDPALAPGVPVFYQVSAFNAGGESAPTATVGVTPLAAFNVNLTSPVNNATGAPTAPTFTWAPTALLGTDQFYDISVFGLNDANPAWITTMGALQNRTSVAYGTVGIPSVNPLQSGKVYQWDIYQAQAQIIYGPSSAALALANGGGVLRGQPPQPSGSLNGPFRLTTMQ